MVNIIIALSKLDEGRNLKNILVRSGFRVTGVCTTGAQAISQADDLHDGIVICGYKLEDMLYSELAECLPPGFELLLMASQRILSSCGGEGVVCLAMPLKLNDFINTVQMMTDGIERRRRKRRQEPHTRSEEEKKWIREAKATLMERNHMTEDEAHKYLQKCSMDSGTGIAETAQMVLMMLRQ